MLTMLSQILQICLGASQGLDAAHMVTKELVVVVVVLLIEFDSFVFELMLHASIVDLDNVQCNLRIRLESCFVFMFDLLLALEP